MGASQLDHSTIELLSEMVGRELDAVDLTPSVTFLATLIPFLVGVVQADGEFLESEREKLVQCINRFLPEQEEVHQLAQELFAGAESLQIHNRLDIFNTLAAPLTVPQRVLLIGMAYEVAMADSNLCAAEIEYLQKVVNSLNISHSIIEALAAKFTGNSVDNTETIQQIKYLIDPANFHELDVCFVKTASDLSNSLFPELETVSIQAHPAKAEPSSFNKLHSFQIDRQELSSVCNSILQEMTVCGQQGWLSGTLTEGIEEVVKRIDAQNFRLAVVGEFSQGKSTLLNAMIGEKIQPTRAIPCSGTITTLRYGDRKRVICRYSDGHEEDIPHSDDLVKEYQNRVAIPKEIAEKSRSEALLDPSIQAIDEIIFEHPNLLLCKNGVEIIDSPGLNENPNRTAITEKLLKNVDAVIFLLNAQQLLSENEEKLIQDVRYELTAKKEEEPARNLFLVVNFMDMLDEDEDEERQAIQNRLENYVREKNLIANSTSALHYISAKAALKALEKNYQDEFLKSFQGFLGAVEEFLTTEPGVQSLRQSAAKIESLIQQALAELEQASDLAEGKVNFSDVERQKILDQIGEVSGRDFSIQGIATRLKERALEQATQSFSVWESQLEKCLEEKSKDWKSEHSTIWGRNKIALDYADQFIQFLKKELEHFSNITLYEQVLKPNLAELDQEIIKGLAELQQSLRRLDNQVHTNFSQQLDLKISELTPGSTSGIIAKGFGTVGTLLGVAGAGALLFSGFGLMALAPLAFYTVAGKITGDVVDRGIGAVHGIGVHNRIKQKVCKEGLRKFQEEKSNIQENLKAAINSIFERQVDAAKLTFKQVMLSCENLLEQHEKVHEETVEEQEAVKLKIQQHRQKLEQFRQESVGILKRYSE